MTLYAMAAQHRKAPLLPNRCPTRVRRGLAEPRHLAPATVGQCCIGRKALVSEADGRVLFVVQGSRVCGGRPRDRSATKVAVRDGQSCLAFGAFKPRSLPSQREPTTRLTTAGQPIAIAIASAGDRKGHISKWSPG